MNLDHLAKTTQVTTQCQLKSENATTGKDVVCQTNPGSPRYTFVGSVWYIPIAVASGPRTPPELGHWLNSAKLDVYVRVCVRVCVFCSPFYCSIFSM